jgi:hypothetical protein
MRRADRLIEFEAQKHETRLGRAGVPAKPGNIEGLDNRDTPRKLGSSQEPFLALSESRAPFGGT